MAPIALGIGLLLLGLLTVVIVCSRMNDPMPPGGALDRPAPPRRVDRREAAAEVFKI